MLKFEIVSSRTVEACEGAERRHVVYMLQVRSEGAGGARDLAPANVERRYTHFLELYGGLRRVSPVAPALLALTFPKKAVIGNFEPELISSRGVGFEALLELVANESRLRESPASIAFFQDVELAEARRYLGQRCYGQALCVFETSFKLLNKVYTDRSRVVLCALCRLVACAAASGGELAGPVERWALLALKRYEAVSDFDLLQLYGPLLHACIAIWETLGRDKSRLVEELNALRKRGMKVDGGAGLMEAVDGLDKA